MATGFRGIGKPRIKIHYGQFIAQVPRNVQRRVRKTGFSFRRGRRRPPTFGFSFNMRRL